MFAKTKTKQQENRNNQPTHKFVIPGTQLEVAIWRAFDHGSSEPTYRWNVARANGEKSYKTFRLEHLVQWVTAISTLADGFSELEDVSASSREALKALSSSLSKVELGGNAMANGGTAGFHQEPQNGLNRAFGT